MTAKEFLQQYRDADREINAKLDQVHRFRELATKTTQTLTGDPEGAGRFAVGRAGTPVHKRIAMGEDRG